MTMVSTAPDHGAARAKPGPNAAAAPLELLWESAAAAPGLRGRDMPESLAVRYGGQLLIPLRSDRPVMLANFVSTIDGVVALGDGPLAGGGPISGEFEPDRFVMALLRATADAVVVGAGTLRGSSRQRWIADHIHPRSAEALASWRRAMGLPRYPTTIVVTGSGAIPTDHPGLSDPSIPIVVATTSSGADRLRDAALGEHVTVAALGAGAAVTGEDLVALTARLGARVVLTEGGPHLLGGLLADDLVDELFLTIAPQLIGRGSESRLGLVEGLALPAEGGRWTERRSIRRAGAHLFLRYARQRGAATAAAATAQTASAPTTTPSLEH